MVEKLYIYTVPTNITVPINDLNFNLILKIYILCFSGSSTYSLV